MKALKEYFSVSERPPIHVKAGRPVDPSTKWKNVRGVGLAKSYEFVDMNVRDRFIVRCIAHETQSGKQDITWTIEGSVVTVLIKATPVGLTESMVEFARTLDDLNRDVGSAPPSVQHDYTF